MLLLLFINSQ